MANLPVLRRRRGESAVPARFEPFAELQEMREQMDRLFGELSRGSLLGDEVWSPPVDLEEADDAWVVEAELPGVKQGDVTVELSDGELAIHGELKERERKGILRRRTRRTGQFDYRVSLPGEIDPDGVQADLKEGVLIVRVPKPASAKPRRIEIKAG